MFVVLAIMVVTSSCSTSETSTNEPTTPSLSAEDGATIRAGLTIAPGQATMNTLTVDGTVVEFSLFVPSTHVPGEPAPLLLALPPGGQTRRQVESTMSQVYTTQAEQRGWVVISPIAPDGVLFFEGSETVIAPLMDQLQAAFPAEGRGPHLAGISNGGISAFRVAAIDPGRYASLTVLPGFPRSQSDIDALQQLVDIPVTLFVGSDDGGWVTNAQETAARLQELGGNVRLDIRAGEGHIIASLWSGPDLWTTLTDALLAGL